MKVHLHLSFRHDFGAGALDDGQEFLLFLVGDFKPVKRRLEIAHRGVEFRIGNVQGSVAGLYFLALIMWRTSTGQGNELDEMFLQLPDVLWTVVPGNRLAAMNGEAATRRT